MDYREQIITTKFLRDLLELYEFELWIDINSNQEKIFRLKDNTNANLGSIEQDEFETLNDVLSRLEIYHNDYIYTALKEREEANEIIEKDDWDIIAKRFIESDRVHDILDTITPTEYKEILEEKISIDNYDVLELLNMEEQFYKIVCEKYIETKDFSKLSFVADKIVLQEDEDIYFFESYKELYDTVCYSCISQDIYDLGVFDENNEWNFYLTFEELRQLDFAYLISSDYPHINEYIINYANQRDFFNRCSLDELDDFENSLMLYYDTEDIQLDEDGTLISRENNLFNSDIIRLSCGLISYNDFKNEYPLKKMELDDKIKLKVMAYFDYKGIKNLMEYGSDYDEGLYHISDLYKDLMNRIFVNYRDVITEDISDGKYITTIIFDNESKIIVDTKANNDAKIITDNLISISKEHNKWLEKEVDKEMENLFDFGC